MKPTSAPTKPPFLSIGVDVGGTKIAAGLVTFPNGIVQARREIPTLPRRGGALVLAAVEQLASELAAEARATGPDVAGIGVGICEIVDRSGAIASANCLDWTGGIARDRLSRIAPTVIEADVRAAARAEALFGAGQRSSVFLYISIGTGIASCLVINGEPFAGARGATGTMASGPLPAFDEIEGRRPAQTLEQIASGPALVARFNVHHGRAQSGQDVLAAAHSGNENARKVIQSAAHTLGGTIGWLVNVLDPERVILGGGLGLSDGLYHDTLIESARRHIWWEGHRDVPIVSAIMGADAGLIGAAAAGHVFDF